MRRPFLRFTARLLRHCQQFCGRGIVNGVEHGDPAVERGRGYRRGIHAGIHADRRAIDKERTFTYEPKLSGSEKTACRMTVFV